MLRNFLDEALLHQANEKNGIISSFIEKTLLLRSQNQEYVIIHGSIETN
jgi:hypothetical protein